MIALYFLVIVAIWFFLTRWLWRLYCKEENSTKKVVFGLVVAVFVVITLWYGGARKFYYDWEVERLCALDGGIKVYETVILPADMFDQWGNINVKSRGYEKPDDEYYSENDMRYYEEGGDDGILIWRSHTKIYRRKDEKLLGEFTGYSRRGGDMPGPWHPSSFSCPSVNLESSIFIKGVTQ